MSKNIKSIYRKVKKATLVWHYSNGYSKDDIRWAHTDLYRTASGEYFRTFLVDRAQHMQILNRFQPNGVTDLAIPAVAIIPLSLNELIAWVANLDHILKKSLRKSDRGQIGKIKKFQVIKNCRKSYQCGKKKVNRLAA